jgi:hypothetical protein
MTKTEDGPSTLAEANEILAQCARVMCLSCMSTDHTMAEHEHAAEHGVKTLSHDPIDDEHKLYDLKTFVATAKAELDDFEKEWTDANQFHRTPHTWTDWWNNLRGYWSW